MSTSTSTASDTQHRYMGATVENIYYAVPTYWGIGDTFSTFAEAAEAARAKIVEAQQKHPQLLLTADPTVDTRMVLTRADGSSEDFVLDRTILK